ncbi:MAG: hypothetical protein M1495_09570 [Bacteroidetes bacterium]|nr:hypothetical protein [Bacteroidota bacterium]MCL6099632.1 hypothetical protein [Bacteroidota bacterium]
MSKKKILFICGSINQTSMMHQISSGLEDYECYFTPYYADGLINFVANKGFLGNTILGGKFRKNTERYLASNNLKIDYRGVNNNYDLIYTCSDLIIPKNIRNKKVILVQEGMTDPETVMFHLVKYLKLPRWLASTSSTGISNQYSLFCVASNGYKDLFIRKGAKEEKIVVTGIPNFDNAKQYLKNDFPHKNYVLVATSDARETLKYDNRKKFIKECVEIAGGRQLIFKLHPNEKTARAKAEINRYAPGALVYQHGNTNHMIANCDVLITKYSSVVYVGLALGKEVHSAFKMEELNRLMPIQNNGTSAERIARIGKHLLEMPDTTLDEIRHTYNLESVLSGQE